VRWYTLSDRQFESLAAGYGEPEAVQVLVGGQLAKRRLLLHAMAQVSRARTGTAAESFRSALALISAVELTRPDAVQAALREPFLDAWASECLRQVPLDGAPLSDGYADLAPFSAAIAIRARWPFALPMRSIDGTVTIPGIGRVDTGPGPVQLSGTGDRLIFVANGERITIDAPYDRPAPAWRPYRHLDAHSALRITLEELSPHRNCFGRPTADPLDEAEMSDLRTHVRVAWRILLRWHPEHARALRAILRAVVPLRAEAGHQMSAASRRAFGAIAIGPTSDGEELALMLIHELQHMKLSALLDLVDCYRPGSGRYYAPWRRDPRPIGAFLQGLYAHVAVADYWRARRVRPDAPALAEFDFMYWREAVAAAAERAGRSPELTQLGGRFVNGLTATVSGWARDPIDTTAVACARAALDADAIAWRYRHHRMRGLAGLTAAWRAGRPCPSLPEPQVLDQPDTLSEPLLARLIRASQRPGPNTDPAATTAGRAATATDPAGSATATDPAGSAATAALLAGDYQAAAAGFAAQLRTGSAGPDAENAWIGLTLALLGAGDAGAPALSHRPEVVAAVTEALAGSAAPPGPIEIARWVSPAIGSPTGDPTP
jgi:HEXXH motif-containing protein